MREDVLTALSAVRDPELDEPITTLGFVASCTVSADGQARVRLRLPTYFCAPNFAFLMVADAYDALVAIPGVRTAEVVLEDHFASDAINAGVAAQAGFVASFDGEAVAELGDLRAQFLRKAVLAGTDLVCRPLIAAGVTPAELVALTLGAAPQSAELDRLRQRRADLGLPADDSAPLLIDPETGAPVALGGDSAASAAGAGDPGRHRRQHLDVLRDAPVPIRPWLTQTHDREVLVKAVRLHKFHSTPVVDDVPEPKVSGPLDVVVKIGGAGVCRTDLHIIEGQWDERMHTPLPYILGHENAGWVHEVGSAVTNVAVGDTVILHPTPTCGLCRACRAGRRHALRELHVPRAVHRWRDGRVPAYFGARLREARSFDPAAGCRGARRRRDYRLSRREESDPAAVSRDDLRGDRGRAGSGISGCSAWRR